MSFLVPFPTRRMLWALGVLIATAQPTLPADRAVAGICDAAALVASRDSGVPLDVLRAISLTETGRTSQGELNAWPWTVNMEGRGKWFDDLNAARAYVDGHFRRGARSFDVGCFQVNYKWHGHAFNSIDEMFDPISNARYAASFLSDLYAEFGDWSAAAGAYHSRTPKYAKRYRARFNRIRADLESMADVVMPTIAVQIQPVAKPRSSTRTNQYPFFVSAVRSAGASLVPRNEAGVALIDPTISRPMLGQR